MATVRPFRGITFDPTRIPDLGLVTCPPYDVISDEDRTELYDRHPYNVVRIISGRDEADDSPEVNRYTRAAGFFESWQWEGVLRTDYAEAMFVYRQAFEDPTGAFRRVWGLLATISLDDKILAHEQTMAGPKADRLALMEAVPSNLSPIYALYSQDCESGTGISTRLRDWAGEPPVADFTDSDHTRHTVWAAHDEHFHAAVTSGLAACPIMVADGHHRLATAQNYRRSRSGSGPWDHIMTLLVDATAENVCILPYHRIVRKASVDPLTVLQTEFAVEDLGVLDPHQAEETSLVLWDEPHPGVFLAFVGDRTYRVTRADSPGDIPAEILRRFALEPMGATSAEHDLSFTPHAEEVAGEVAAGRAVAGFCMQPVSVGKIWDLAVAGAKMPEKSTYFHPKPKDGVVIRSLED